MKSLKHIVSILEVCFLISGWEMDIDSHISYTDTARNAIVLPFIEHYI